MKKTFSVVTSVMLTLMMLFVSCEQGAPPALQTGPNDLVSVSFTKVEAKSINVDGIGTVTTPELSELYFQYKAVKTAGEGASAVQGEKTEWTDLGAKGLSQTIQLSRGNWTIHLRAFATDALRTAAGTAETASTQAVFEGSLSQDIGSNLTSRNESVNVSLNFTNPDGTGAYVIEVTIPAEYASQQAKVKVTVTPASGDAQVQTHQFTEGTVSHTYSFAGLNNGIATVKLEYMDSGDMEIGDPASSSILVMTDMTTNGSATVTETNTFAISFAGSSVNGRAESYERITFNSMLDIYPDTAASTDIVIGYTSASGTPVVYPFSRTVARDSNGNVTASSLGLTPVIIEGNRDALDQADPAEAWFGADVTGTSHSLGPSLMNSLERMKWITPPQHIPDALFWGSSSLTEAPIPEGVISIGYGAYHEAGITTLHLPSTLKTIGEAAFDSCNQLESLEIPSTVETIGDFAFQNAALYSSLVINEGVKSIGESAFSSVGLTSVEIPSSVETIGKDAFAMAWWLEDLVLNEGIKRIEEGAFYDTKLTSVEIPDSVTFIGSGAFDTDTVIYLHKSPYDITVEDIDSYNEIYFEQTYEGTKEQYYKENADIHPAFSVMCSDGEIAFSKENGFITGYTNAGATQNSVYLYPSMMFDDSFTLEREGLEEVIAEMYEGTAVYTGYSSDDSENPRLGETYVSPDNYRFEIQGNYIFKEMTEAKKNFGFIFYDAGAEEGVTYTFYDRNDRVIPYDNPEGSAGNRYKIADLADAVRVEITGTPTRDRFYAYYPTEEPEAESDMLYYGFYGNTDIQSIASGTAVGQGKSNTAAIMNYISQNSLSSETDAIETSVANAGDNISVSLSSHEGYNLYRNVKTNYTSDPINYIWDWLETFRSQHGSDWYIPSKDEMIKLVEAVRYTPDDNDNWQECHYANRGIGLPNPFSLLEQVYISSTSVDGVNASSYSYRYHTFSSNVEKGSDLKVLPVRSF